MNESSFGKKHRRSELTQLLLFRIMPIILACVVAFCGFRIFSKLLGESVARSKYDALAQRGDIDDPSRSDYESSDGYVSSIDWNEMFSSYDPNGFDPLALSPLGVVDGTRPSDVLSTSELESQLGYTNHQSTIWAIHDNINSDVSAWIYIPGLGINYPIALPKANSEDYYLNHTYDGAGSTSGTLFFPSVCTVNPLSENLIVHGHNMRDNTMFATLKNYVTGTQSFYNAHRYIFLDTLYGTYRYEIYSAYKTQPEDIYLQTFFGSSSTFLDWCSQTNAKGLFPSDTTSFSSTDHILTLSTCDNTAKYRYIIHARLVYPSASSTSSSSSSGNVIISTGDAEPGADPASSNPAAVTFSVNGQYRVYLQDHTSSLNLRSQASTQASVVTYLNHGFLVTVLEDVGEWVKVKTSGGMEGYLLKVYLVAEKDFSYVIPSATIRVPTPAPTTVPTATAVPEVPTA